MVRKSITARVILAVLAVALVSTAHPIAARFTGISLKISSESAPPGAMAQIKVSVTEPKPISTGKGRLSTGFRSTSGIALRSPLNDAYGVAVVDSNGLDLSVVSPAGSFGTALDYPVLTVTGTVPATTPLGTSFPVDLDAASLRLLDLSGTPYPVEVSPGQLVAAPGVSIHDVVPGSAELPAGAVVRIFGGGFQPGVQVRFSETKLASVEYVSRSELRVVLARQTAMHGRLVRVSNPDGTRASYYSYQRTLRAAPSADPILAASVPLFPLRFATSTIVATGSATTGVALQNIATVAATVWLDLLRPDATLVQTVVVTLQPNCFFVRDVRELFTQPPSPGSTVRVRSSVPLQVMGVAVDASGNATPIVPR